MTKILALFVALIIAGHAMAETVRTKSWYITHPTERQRVNALCRDNPGEARHSANCINALEATDAVVARNYAMSIPVQPLMIDRCDTMPPLFQAANRCGAYRPKP